MIERYPEFQKQMGLKNWVCIIGSNQTSDMKNADVFNCSLCHAPSCCYHVSRVILSLAETAGENSHTKDWVIATEYFLFCEKQNNTSFVLARLKALHFVLLTHTLSTRSQ